MGQSGCELADDGKHVSSFDLLEAVGDSATPYNVSFDMLPEIPE